MSARDGHLDRLAEALRGVLIERRRAQAVAGRAPAQGLEEAVAAVVEERAAILDEEDRGQLRARIINETIGLGPLEPLLADPGVEEVMVNGPGIRLRRAVRQGSSRPPSASPGRRSCAT